MSLSEKLNKLGKNLIGNIAFGLFLFFLIKFAISLSIQFKYGLESIKLIDIFLIVTFFIILLIFLVFFKFNKALFSTFTEKINPPYKYQTTNLFRDYVSTKIDLKTFYPLFLTFSNLLNSIFLVFWYDYFEWHIVPICMNLIGLGLVLGLKFYNYSNMYRAAWNYFAGINIQCFLLLKHYNYSLTMSQISELELSSSVYLPLTVFILVLISVILSLSFYLYTIKRIRCCILEI
jgi:hypothetical protein